MGPCNKTKWYLSLLLLLCVFAKAVRAGSSTKQRQFVVKFTKQMSQKEQQQYIRRYFKGLSSPEYEYVYRTYLPRYMQTDFAVIRSEHDMLNWTAKGFIESVTVDGSVSISRKLMSSTSSTIQQNSGGTSDTFLPHSFVATIKERGLTGKGVKVGIFDTGLTRGHPSFNSRRYERTDWTTEDTLDDFVGHGTFISGIIAGEDPNCPGLSPEVELHIFRVFDIAQNVYTSWFLDAFNYAMYVGIDVINLSIGGTDHGDIPFIDKINEMAANGIIVVSAAGNFGPVWGTQQNPADQNSAISVGGWIRERSSSDLYRDESNSANYAEGSVASFSSRGMTLWNWQSRVGSSSANLDEDGEYDGRHGAENSISMGRVKPDIIAPSYRLLSSSHTAPFGCRTHSGTSVATPVVVASISLILSCYSPHSKNRIALSNVAAIKQILLSSATPVRSHSIYEQGSGLLNATAALHKAMAHTPHVSIIPSHLSNLEVDCPYLWPWCEQRLFSTSQPLLATLTILNSLSSTSYISRISWTESSALGSFSDQVSFVMNEFDSYDHQNRFTVSLRTNLLSIQIQSSRVYWPWSGTMEVSISANADNDSKFAGILKCELSITLKSLGTISNGDESGTTAKLAMDLLLSPPPAKEKRVLWDTFHSLSYPSAFIPSDDLNDPTKLDLRGDHIYTNYRDAYLKLTQLGYVVEVLRKPFTCFDADLYSILVVCDVEEMLTTLEVNKLQQDVRQKGLSMLVIGDWYDKTGLFKGATFDDGTHSKWFPVTAGSNIPALNALLAPFGAAFGLEAFTGIIKLGSNKILFQSGNTIAEWPAGGYLWQGKLSPAFGGNLRAQFRSEQAYAGFLQVGSDEDADSTEIKKKKYRESSRGGRIVAYGDSTFVDSVSFETNSRDGSMALLEAFMHFLRGGRLPAQNDGWESLPKLLVDSFVDDKLSPHSNVRYKDPSSIVRDAILRQNEHIRYSKLFENNGEEIPLEGFCSAF